MCQPNEMTPDEVLAVLSKYTAPELCEARTAVSALIARNAELEADNKALREDAERWRHARKILISDHIETAQSEYDNWIASGESVCEDEFVLADKAIDAARAEACSNG